MTTLDLRPSDIASYFLQKAVDDGDLITNLKMQKLIYYAYSWVLTLNKQKLFAESIEAWPNGPVTPSLYRALNKYGSSPIDATYISKRGVQKVNDLSDPIKYTLNSVYASYVPLSAFELVSMTHNELPWKKARHGLDAAERSNNGLQDTDILEYFSKL